MLPIVGVIGGIAARFASAGMLKFLAQKALLYSLIVTVLPAAIYALIVKIMKEMITLSEGAINQSGMQANVLHLVGMGAWIGQQINIAQSIAIIMSAVALRYTLNMISRRL